MKTYREQIKDLVKLSENLDKNGHTYASEEIMKCANSLVSNKEAAITHYDNAKNSVEKLNKNAQSQSLWDKLVGKPKEEQKSDGAQLLVEIPASFEKNVNEFAKFLLPIQGVETSTQWKKYWDDAIKQFVKGDPYYDRLQVLSKWMESTVNKYKDMHDRFQKEALAFKKEFMAEKKRWSNGENPVVDTTDVKNLNYGELWIQIDNQFGLSRDAVIKDLEANYTYVKNSAIWKFIIGKYTLLLSGSTGKTDIDQKDIKVMFEQLKAKKDLNTLMQRIWKRLSGELQIESHSEIYNRLEQYQTQKKEKNILLDLGKQLGVGGNIAKVFEILAEDPDVTPQLQSKLNPISDADINILWNKLYNDVIVKNNNKPLNAGKVKLNLNEKEGQNQIIEWLKNAVVKNNAYVIKTFLQPLMSQGYSADDIIKKLETSNPPPTPPPTP